jgi:hypothetical protein
MRAIARLWVYGLLVLPSLYIPTSCPRSLGRKTGTLSTGPTESSNHYLPKARNSNCSLLYFPSTAMLILTPQNRYSARACLDRALGLGTSQCCGHSSLGAEKHGLRMRALSQKAEEDEFATNRFSTEIQEDDSPTNRCSIGTRCDRGLPDTLPPKSFGFSDAR